MGTLRYICRCGLRHLRRISALSLLACALVILGLLPGCGGGTSAGSAEAAPISKKAPKSAAKPKASKDKATGAPYTMPTEIPIPQASASATPLIDTAGAASGYVAAAAQSPARLKFQVKCGEMAYNYDMPNDGTPAIFPINMGDGSYAFRIMENIEGNSYAELDAAYLDVSLSSEFSPFLIPNVFCDYDAGSKCVAKAREVAKKATNEGEVVRDICTFVAKEVSYDYDKAEILAQGSGYIPNPDATLAEGTGVCFDFASLTAAMLRSLGMPTKVMTGYVSPGDLYHAWIMVYADGTWKSALFSVDPKTWSRCDVTFASAGASSVTGSGTDYTDRYTY